MYLNHVQLIGFLGKDPEKRQVRGNGANFRFCPSRRSSRGKTRTTNGNPKPSGTAS